MQGLLGVVLLKRSLPIFLFGLNITTVTYLYAVEKRFPRVPFHWFRTASPWQDITSVLLRVNTSSAEPVAYKNPPRKPQATMYC